MISIKTKLISLTSLSVCLTAIILGGLAIWHVTRISNEGSLHAIQLIGVAEKEHLDITMGNIEHAVDSMKDVILREIDDPQLFAKDDSYRAIVTRKFEELFYTIAYHTTGAVAYYVRYDPVLVPQNKQGFFWTKHSRFSSFAETTLTDLSLYAKDDIEHVGWYYIPVINGKATWMTPYFNQNLGIYMISYVIPLYVYGKLIGVVGMDVDFSIIIDEINQLNIYENGYAYITNERGQVIYHKDYEAGTTDIAKATDMEEVSLKMNNDWNIVVTVPHREVNHERNVLTLKLVIVTVLIVAIFLALTIFITKKIIMPLLELTAATKKIAEGDLDINLTHTSDDEIGILAEAFKRTVHHLPEYMYRDSLTGLRNASSYKRAVTQIKERMRLEDTLQFGIVICDVNNLKQTNDSYGHDVGNQLIIQAANLICRIFAHSPVFRVGGDEFVVILERSDYKNQESLLQQFDADTTTFTAAGKTFELSVARGLAVYDKTNDSSYEAIAKRADEAMYANKKDIKERMQMRRK